MLQHSKSFRTSSRRYVQQRPHNGLHKNMASESGAIRSNSQAVLAELKQTSPYKVMGEAGQRNYKRAAFVTTNPATFQ